jgi:hypothetical protein
VYDPITDKKMEEEWQPLSSSWHKNKPATLTQPIKQALEQTTAGDHHINRVNNITYHVVEESRLTAALSGCFVKSSGQHMVTTIEEKGGRHQAPQVYSQSKLSSLLFKHKDQLKKEIARKRNVLEKELSQAEFRIRTRI